MDVSPKVNQKQVLYLPNRPHGAHYVVGGEVQDVLEGVVVHHEGVVTDRPQIIRTPYHGGALVQKYGFNTFKYWLTVDFLDFLTTLPSRVKQHPTQLLA